MPFSLCPSVNQNLVDIKATNGNIYKVCLNFKVNPIGNIWTYTYPDEIVLKDGTGYLKRRPDNIYGIVYEFISTAIISPSNGKISPGKDKPPTNDTGQDDNQIIKGIDNTYLIFGAIAVLFLLSKK